MRVGVRGYTPFFGPSRKVRFYVNPLLIVSNYRQSAILYTIDSSRPPQPLTVSGTNLIPALRVGFTKDFNDRLTLDFGAHKALKPSRYNYFGFTPRNYQPGAGAGQSSPFISYLQGFATLKVSF